MFVISFVKAAVFHLCIFYSFSFYPLHITYQTYRW